MKRVMVYALVLAAALMYPVQRSDLGKLKPVQTVLIYQSADQVVLQTDTEDFGCGNTVAKALQDLKDMSDGIVYLDSADYLLVRKGAENRIPELKAYLKESVRVCYAHPAADINRAASFLSVHPPEVTLRKWDENSKLQTLFGVENRLRLS